MLINVNLLSLNFWLFFMFFILCIREMFSMYEINNSNNSNYLAMRLVYEIKDLIDDRRLMINKKKLLEDELNKLREKFGIQENERIEKRRRKEEPRRRKGAQRVSRILLHSSIVFLCCFVALWLCGWIQPKGD